MPRLSRRMSQGHNASIAGRPRLRSAFLLIVSVFVLLHCGNGQGTATDPLDLDPSLGPCTTQTGVAAVNRLLWAFNHKSGDDAASLFAPDIVKVVQPMLEVSEFGWKAETASEVRRIVQSTTRTWFRLLGEPAASVSPAVASKQSLTSEPVVVVGPIHWSASGDQVVDDAGGKAEVDCASRTFVRILL